MVHSAVQGSLSIPLFLPLNLANTVRQKRKMPPDLSLPFSTRGRDILQYYKYLHTLVIPEINKFHIVTAIPLVFEGSKYEVFKAITVPLPNPSMNMSLTYSLEAPYLALSTDRKQYSLLNEAETLTCSATRLCHLLTPIWSVSQAPSCATSLFLKTQSAIEKHCKVNLDVLGSKPFIQHLFDGHWLISIPEELNLNMTCFNSSRTHQSQLSLLPGTHMHVVITPEQCSASSKYFQLPSLVQRKSSVNTKNQFEQALQLSKLIPNAWNNSSAISKHLQSLNAKMPLNNSWLKQIKNVPVQHLQSLLLSA